MGYFAGVPSIPPRARPCSENPNIDAADRRRPRRTSAMSQASVTSESAVEGAHLLAQLGNGMHVLQALGRRMFSGGGSALAVDAADHPGVAPSASNGALPGAGRQGGIPGQKSARSLRCGSVARCISTFTASHSWWNHTHLRMRRRSRPDRCSMMDPTLPRKITGAPWQA